ncbi:MAG: PqiC family protein [Desulfobacterales bacterium]
MMNRLIFLITTVILGAVMVILAGCASYSQPSKFYVLNVMPQLEATAQVTTGDADILMGIGPITLPAYLNRSHIVTRTGENELKISEFHLWAEPLKDNIARVMMESLSRLLNTNQIVTYPWRTSSRVAYQITLDVTRFDVGSDGHAQLDVYWTVFGKDGKEEMFKKKSIFRTPAKSRDYQEMVAAQNRTLIEFSREIASTIERVHQ